MVKFLEDILFAKTKDTQSEILFAQWNYDKKIIPSALQAVSNLFPHYSLHDESHSITIINNIVRVLGKENIVKLSAIDIWLILEAAYSHDIGMVVSSERLIESINSSSFIDFFSELLNDKKNGLHEFANQFQVVDNKIRYKDNLFNLELNDGIKFILAEFFRRVHADRSQEIITNPLSELSLASPRGVIAPRIFKILGNICSSHTKNFTEVLKLPFCEVGIDIEDAHPRFIACLLRIGDLLDLDNNRFSEVMLRTLTKVPIDTLSHKAKHLSIESFRVDRDIIEITAKCKDYDTANITQHWFNYLNSEISNQMINWNSIVPIRDLGYLPAIGNLKVELSDYDFIDGKHKPKFTVDTDKALALLQGAGIYDGAYQCIREILQNAVDSSLIRIWLENSPIGKDFSSPQSPDFIELTKNYRISVTIKEKPIEGEWKNWEIQIEDKGTGISSSDLKFLMNTGSSSKNRERINIIDSMPAWMKPSGTFGIGFQSIFMLTDVVNIETKSFFTEEFQIIELNSPNSKKDGDILIQKKKTSHAVKPGAKITIAHKTKAIPNGYSISSVHATASRIAHNFDPFSHESMDIELGRILDEVVDFAQKSYLPIKLVVDNNEIATTVVDTKFKFFDYENSMELDIFYGDLPRCRCKTYYKNQKADSDFSFNFIGFNINIHKDKASEVLTLNRNKIKEEYKDELFNGILKSSFRIILKEFHEIFDTDYAKHIGSMYLQYYAHKYNMKEFEIKRFNQWEDFEIDTGAKTYRINELLNSIKTLKLVSDHNISWVDGDIYELNGEELIIKMHGREPSKGSTKFFLLKASECFTNIVSKNKPDNNITEVIFSKEKQGSPITEEYFYEIIINLKDHSISARAIIPCVQNYFALRLKEGAFQPYVYNFHLDWNVQFSYPKMLSPYVTEETESGRHLKKVINEKVIDWVFENRYDTSTTKEQVRDTYETLCKEVDLRILSTSVN